jgi:hypothetical protein
MSDPIQSNLDRTKKFVKKHQIAVACAATAVVTWKFTKDVPSEDHQHRLRARL